MPQVKGGYLPHLVVFQRGFLKALYGAVYISGTLPGVRYPEHDVRRSGSLCSIQVFSKVFRGVFVVVLFVIGLRQEQVKLRRIFHISLLQGLMRIPDHLVVSLLLVQGFIDQLRHNLRIIIVFAGFDKVVVGAVIFFFLKIDIARIVAGRVLKFIVFSLEFIELPISFVKFFQCKVGIAQFETGLGFNILGQVGKIQPFVIFNGFLIPLPVVFQVSQFEVGNFCLGVVGVIQNKTLYQLFSIGVVQLYATVGNVVLG